MLHDLRGTYIRREGYDFERNAPSILQVVVFLAASAAISAALIFAALRWGIPAINGEVAALYAP